MSFSFSFKLHVTCRVNLLRILAAAGNQSGIPVFFLADAPARYNA